VHPADTHGNIWQLYPTWLHDDVYADDDADDADLIVRRNSLLSVPGKRVDGHQTW
jgi:hypothetical protein